MALELPEGLNLYNFVNLNMAQLLTKVQKLQVYIDDWDKLPQDFKDLAKSDLAAFLDQSGTFLEEVKAYIGQL